MLKEKRGEGLPFNIIIIAILGIVVLFVIIFAFHRSTGGNIDILNSCTSKGGVCNTESEGCGPSEIQLPGAECVQDKPICCKEI
jgi:hypothetical protein